MSGKIKVLLAIGSMSGGGSERQLLGVLKYLDRSQFEPILYLISKSGELLSEIPNDVPVISFWDRHTQPRINYPGALLRKKVQDFAQVLSEEKIELVYDRTYHMTLITAAATRKVNVPRISVAVTDPKLDYQQTGERFQKIKLKMLGKAYRDADRVLAVSDRVRSSLVTPFSLDDSKVQTFDNFLDLERVRQLSQENPPDLDPQRFHLVITGRLRGEKGHIHLLKALQLLVQINTRKELLLHILGAGPIEDELKSFVAEQQLDEHVHFAGFEPNPFRYYRQAQLFCLPSLYDGRPNALIEAMACEIPVMASDCPGGVSEILKGGELGVLVPPADAVRLADAIEDFLQNPAQLKEKTAAVRLHVEQTYAPEDGIERLQNLFLNVLQEYGNR